MSHLANYLHATDRSIEGWLKGVRTPMKQGDRTMSRESSLIKRIPLIALAFCTLMASPLRADDASQSAFSFGTYWGPPISELKKIGFSGIAGGMWKQPGLDRLGRFQEAIGDDDSFKIHAGYIHFYFDRDLAAQNAHLDKAIQALAKSDSKLWLLVSGRGEEEVPREEIVAFLHSVAERGKAAGVEVVIYPEWSGPGKDSIIKTAEEALSYIKEAESDNLFVTLHLCHELKAGNGDRLEDIAAKIKPWLRLATINGADEDAADELDGWTRTIQPLGMGTYDSSKLLKALKSIGYEGPVILHTGGGLARRTPAGHQRTSFKRFQEIVDALNED